MRNRDLITDWHLERVRSALRSGRAGEDAIVRYTGLNWVEVHASLEVLTRRKEVQRVQEARWYGTASETADYRTRKQTGVVLPRAPRRKQPAWSDTKKMLRLMLR